jgi:hypothetical protein
MRRSLLQIVIGTALALGGACDAGKGSLTGGGGHGSGATGGGGETGGAGAGGTDGRVACGATTCDVGMFCCNPACGICAPPGGGCVAGCAAGQSGGGGAGGAGGGTADGGETCDELALDYANAFVAASACTPGAANQCQTLAPPTIGNVCNVCGDWYVNDATTLTAIRSQWARQGCALPIACPAILCRAPTPASCVAVDAASPGGVCSPPTPVPAS